MITINLLKNYSNKPVRRRESVAKAAVTVIVLLIVLIVAGGGAFLLRWWLRLPRSPKPIAAATVQTEKTAPAGNAPLITESKFEPSTHVTSKIVEDVVGEIDVQDSKTKSSEFIGLQYREMSRGEKINYEVLFAKNALQILTSIVPDGIGFTSLSIDTFTALSAAGLGPNRDLVGSLFAALRRERLDLLGPPRSYINQSGGRGYRFFFTCAPSFGMNDAEPYQATDRIEPRENLPALKKNFAGIAKRNGIVVRGGLKPKSIERWGEFLRFGYHVSGRSSYRDFVKFVLDIYRSRLTCAFATIRLAARGDAAIDIEADVIFTLRE